MLEWLKYLTGHRMTKSGTAKAIRGWDIPVNGYHYYSGVHGNEIHKINTHALGSDALIRSVKVYTMDGRLMKEAIIYDFPEGTETTGREYDPPGSFFSRPIQLTWKPAS